MKSDQVPILQIPNEERIRNLGEIFNIKYGIKPSFYVRVPGRVNIIGEHIDYCGYPVLPMAVEQNILLAVAVTDELELHIQNVNDKYEEKHLQIDSVDNLEIPENPAGKPFWYNYVLCGIKGALEHLKNKVNCGLKIVVDGNIPPASGLSSSSALVSAACLAFLYAHNAELSKKEIASLCARCEWYIGTQGGGMDQAIAFLAEKYSAQYITWNPLNATAVALPEEAAFVVAHSLAEANKAATNHYNVRVVECRLAAKIILALEGKDPGTRIVTLGEAQKLLSKNLEDMVTLVLKHLSQDLYVKKDICKLLNLTEEELENTYVTSNTKNVKEFKLKQRALHVYQEAIRVDEFVKYCTQPPTNGVKNGTSSTNGSNGSSGEESGAGDSMKVNTLSVLGKLMCASHESLKTLYECSHENLDRLVDLSKKLDVAARLTGAGWGGCLIAMCHKSKVEDYIQAIKEDFYEEYCNIDMVKADQYIFATVPNDGAAILKI